MPSSVISSIRYDRPTRSLFITFVSGLVYRYLSVPERVYKEIKTASSKGAYLNHFIKGKFQFEKQD
jgi:hypothetical protein